MLGILDAEKRLTSFVESSATNVDFVSLNFFIFSVGRNPVDFASPRGRKSFAGPRFVSGGEAIFTRFRLGGWTKAPRREALFVASSSCGRAKTI